MYIRGKVLNQFLLWCPQWRCWKVQHEDGLSPLSGLAGESTGTIRHAWKSLSSNHVPEKEYIFYVSDYRCLPAGGKRVFFPQCVVGSLRAHSLIPLQLCVPFDPELIKKCKSKLYLINVIFVLKLCGVKTLSFSSVFGFLMCDRSLVICRPHFLINRYGRLFLAFLEFKEIKSNDFITIAQVFSSMLRSLLMCSNFSNMTVTVFQEHPGSIF